MGQNYTNKIETSAGFSFKANAPIDDRLSVSSISDLTYLVDNGMAYDGMIVGVSNKGIYKYFASQNQWIRMAKTKSITRDGSVVEVLDEVLDNDAVITITIKDGAVTTAKLADSAVTNKKIGEAVSISKGGTGKTTAEEALKALNGIPLKEYSDSTMKTSQEIIYKVKNSSGTVTNFPSIDGICFTIPEGNNYSHLIFAVNGKRYYHSIVNNSFTELLIGETEISNESITSAKIKNGTIVNDDIADSTITAAKLIDSIITTAKIKDGNVTTVKIADDAVTTAKIKDGNVTTVKIADDAVTSEKIKDKTIVAGNIADGTITALQLLDATITAVKLASNSVITEKIKDGNVTTTKLAELCVTTAKIADSAVTTAKLAELCVTTAKIANDAVTSEKIKDGTIVESNLSSELNDIIIKGTAGTTPMSEGDTLEAGKIYIQYSE